MNQASSHITSIKAISEYASLKSELETLRMMVHDLQDQLKAANITNNNNVGPSESIIVHHKNKQQYIPLSKIIMFKAETNYTSIFLTDGTRILTSKTLTYWNSKVITYDDFIRPHRSFIINKAHILTYQTSSRTIELTGGLVAKVSRDFRLQENK